MTTARPCPLTQRALTVVRRGLLTLPAVVAADPGYDFLLCPRDVTQAAVGGQVESYVGGRSWDDWMERLSEVDRHGLWPALLKCYWPFVTLEMLRDWALACLTRRGASLPTTPAPLILP